jgi:hypothetical protein
MIRYYVFSWTRPVLTPEQEIEIGRLIAAEGRDAFLKGTHPFPHAENANRKPVGPVEWIAVIVFIGLLLWSFVLFWLPMLIVIVPISLYSGGSYLYAQQCRRRWVDEMIGKYAASVAREPGTKV